ncbi:Fe-S cluster assembly protein SufD [Lichenihabitans sp. Uapishka_5]|uniref:Fe-S cluster assembly protein SufD n=1 Tax=Lichenihabitans sp. Uapishka_5 TaxID=3037302 RepID=UPI0029E7E9D3|nr:Fe-S cluster assembly protein SufD [Lichenihabitans sp. Uapishka_5]MDX7950041.1 Fe-S cluster assembly protein SufD [Lichenihabitans sp. Uapishka_5]
MTAEITRINTAAETKLTEQFRSANYSAHAFDPAFDRSRAFERYSKAGLPHRRIEAWHYTDLRAILRDAHAPTVAPSADLVAQAKAHLAKTAEVAGARVVLIDGHFEPSLSRDLEQPGLSVRSLLDVLGAGASDATALLATHAEEEAEAVLALNAALMQGGAVVTVTAGATIAEPVEVVMLTSGAQPSAVTTRSLVAVGAKASVVVLERQESLGQAPQQSNHALILSVGDGATLHHVVLQDGTDTGTQAVTTVLARLGAESNLMSFALVTGSGFVRRQNFMEFAGDTAKGALRGVALLDGKAHADTTLVVTHKALHCESRELYKHILDDETTGIFQGKVIVAPGAQKTDGKMMSRAIFLNDGATMYNKPELEIFADDVVCGHGATAGFLNEDQLFYLQARGIPKAVAEGLLLEAFAAEAVEDVGTEAIRDQLTESIGLWLHQRHQ